MKLLNTELNKDFNLSQTDVMFNHIQAEMLKWFKDPKANSYSENDANKLISSVKSQICEMQLIGCSLQAKEKFVFRLEGVVHLNNERVVYTLLKV